MIGVLVEALAQALLCWAIPEVLVEDLKGAAVRVLTEALNVTLKEVLCMVQAVDLIQHLVEHMIVVLIEPLVESLA